MIIYEIIEGPMDWFFKIEMVSSEISSYFIFDIEFSKNDLKYLNSIVDYMKQDKELSCLIRESSPLRIKMLKLIEKIGKIYC